jgi:hypothetical protein
MARNSTGTYTRLAGALTGVDIYQQEFTTGVFVNYNSQDAEHNDLAVEISDSLSRSGKGGMLAALTMNTNKIVGLGDGTAATDAATKGQIDAIATAASTALSAANAAVALRLPLAGGTITGIIKPGNVGIALGGQLISEHFGTVWLNEISKGSNGNISISTTTGNIVLFPNNSAATRWEVSSAAGQGIIAPPQSNTHLIGGASAVLNSVWTNSVRSVGPMIIEGPPGNGGPTTLVVGNGEFDMAGQNFSATPGALTTYWQVKFNGAIRYIPLHLP